MVEEKLVNANSTKRRMQQFGTPQNGCCTLHTGLSKKTLERLRNQSGGSKNIRGIMIIITN